MRLVSVVIPTHNRAKIVLNAIDSVLKQTIQHWELIIVDDGSTDGTKKAIEPYLKDTRINYFYIKKAGVSAARNFGIKKSKGDFISFLDSDDEYHSQKLSSHISAMLEAKADLSISNRNININGKQKFSINKKSQFVNVEKLVTGEISISASLMMGKRSVFKKFKFDKNLFAANDLDFLLRATSRYKLYFYNQSLVTVNRSLNYERLSTNFRGKLYAFECLQKKMIAGIYALGPSGESLLEEKLSYLNGMYLFLIGDFKTARIFLKKYFLIESASFLRRIITLLLFPITYSRFSSKVTVIIMKFCWSKGISLQ